MGENITNRRYPDPLADNATKKADAYGVAWGSFIASEWLNGGTDMNRMGTRTAELQYLDSFRTGNVDISKFKDFLNMSDDQAWTSIDWTFFQIIPKFIDIIRDGFPLDLFEMKANGIDALSLTKKENYRSGLEDDMLSMPFTEAFSEGLGQNFKPMGFVPESEAELDLHMIDFRQRQEIAIEICLAKIYEMNDWVDTWRDIIEDITTYGIAVCSNTIDPEIALKIERVDPENFIYSKEPSGRQDKKGCYYFAQLTTIRIEELEKATNGKFSSDDLRSMATSVAGQLGNPAKLDDGDDNFSHFNVQVMKYAFKTTLNETYKVKEHGKLVAKEDTWEKHEDSLSEKLQGSYDVWFEGNYIVHSDYVYGHRVMKEMVRPLSNINKVDPPFTVFELRMPSMVKRMASIANDLQTTKLKIQQHISTSKPAGVAIDIDAIQEVTLGNGQTLSVPDVIDIYNHRGDLLYSGRNLEGDYIQGSPIIPIQGGISTELQQLIIYYNQNIKMLYDVTGVNEAVDGSGKSDALVGVQQLKISASNKATRHILNAALSILKRSCEFNINRVQNMSMYGERYEKAIESLLGKNNIDILEIGKNLHLFEYSTTIDIAPDAEERADFKVSLDNAVQAGHIDVTDRTDLLSSKNLKVAIQDLKIRIEKRKRRVHAEKLELIDKDNTAKEQAALAIEQEKQKSFQMQIQADQQKSNFDTVKEMSILDKTHENALELFHLESAHELKMKMLDRNIQNENNALSEDRKDLRNAKSDTNASKMVEQRSKGGKPEDFASQEEFDQFMKNQQANPDEKLAE